MDSDGSGQARESRVMEAAAMKSGQLLSIINTNTDVQPKTAGTIISQVENRQHGRGGVELADASSYQRPNPIHHQTPGPAVGTHFLFLFPSCRILKLFAVTLIVRGTRGRIL